MCERARDRGEHELNCRVATTDAWSLSNIHVVFTNRLAPFPLCCVMKDHQGQRCANYVGADWRVV